MAVDAQIDEKLVSTMPFDSDLEAIGTFTELEHRKALVASGQSKLLDESEALDALKEGGCHI